MRWFSFPSSLFSSFRLVRFLFGGRHATVKRFLFLFTVGLLSTYPVWDVGARGLPAQEGIGNFGKISENLYRGAQPDVEGMKSLKKLGVKLIVNLRMPDDAWKEEAAAAQANGILYTNFPMHGMGTPNPEQIKQLLGLFESFSGPIFVHCRFGCDRTGTIVACYRIAHDHWSNALALREAKRYGISRWEILMRRFVRNFAPISNPASVPDLRQARAD